MRRNNSNLQLVKYLMAFLIILYHDWTAFGYQNIIFLEPIIGASMSVFILITGYFKVDSKNYNFLKLFMIVMCCLIINTIVCLSINNFTNILDHVNNLFLGGRDWWYIWCFLLLQPFIKYLNDFVNKTTSTFLFISICLLFIFSSATTSLYRFGQVFTMFNLFYMITFYLIGAWIKRYYNLEGIKKFLIPMFLFLLIYIPIMYYNMNVINYKISMSTSNIITFLMSIPLFLIFLSIPSYSNKFIDYLGKLSLYVYLFHYLIQIIFMEKLFNNNFLNFSPALIRNIVYALIILIGTTLISVPICYSSEKFSKYTTSLIFKIWDKYKIY
ncbi:acyltransferase family protein [Spiroplasma endosymbiont of Dioctria linearis]|uniref:acyltransferase family protein n=1 Tax=Spiroplasma endosymbiont of Dioctria linearis TaxID=3066290 RepID=UPI00313B4CBC